MLTWGPLRTLAIFRLALSYWRDARVIARAQHRLPESLAQKIQSDVYRRGGERFCREAVRLGGLIIKVGQFLSARTDILPLEFTRELRVLQDHVPPSSFPAIRRVIEKAYGASVEEVFLTFDPEPIAAASLGQVHRAALRQSAQEVAVKVQRPDIQYLAAVDLKALGHIMAALRRWTTVGRRIDTVRVFREFREMVYRELDYLQEEKNMAAFRENFARDADVYVPRSYPDLTRQTVLVMEYVQGVKLTAVDDIVRLGLEPKNLSRILVNAFLRQIIVDGLVQIDPHPGNFLAAADGKVIFLDFGMMGRIPPQDLIWAAQLLEGLLVRNPRQVVDAIAGLGFLKPDAQKPLMVRAVSLMIDRMWGTPLIPGQALDRTVAEFQDFLYQEPLEFPAQYMFLGRAIGMVFALVSALDPELDWLAVLRQEALPLLNAKRREQDPDWLQGIGQMIGKALGPEAETLVTTVGEKGLEALSLIGRLPRELDRVLNAIEEGTVVTKPDLTTAIRRLDRLSDQLDALMDLLVALALGGLWILLDHRHAILGRDVVAVVGLAFMVRFVLGRRRASRRLIRRRPRDSRH